MRTKVTAIIRICVDTGSHECDYDRAIRRRTKLNEAINNSMMTKAFPASADWGGPFHENYGVPRQVKHYAT